MNDGVTASAHSPDLPAHPLDTSSDQNGLSNSPFDSQGQLEPGKSSTTTMKQMSETPRSPPNDQPQDSTMDTVDAKDTNAPPSNPSKRPQPSRTPSNEHGTLKYSLLGPSLTKAGQDAVDQQKVSEVIYNASKGSKFFNNEEARDKNLTEKINRILARKRQLEKLDLSSDLRRADDYIAELELGRDLSQTVVHIDCDAFYAAVEELDRPELRDVPMAVGKGVLTTCNYHARKFGCRSGMAGFVARKLCPQLICLPLNFQKYSAKAEEVRAILAQYDPRFESASVDEAYLNITQYCEEHQMDPEEVVSQLRAEVHNKTQITVSAGIAANAKLAKIGSNRNKPNGQFRLANDRQTIMDFMKNLPTRKVNGVGRVFERELDAVGIKTCGDIYPLRTYLSQLFGQKAFQFLMQCYLGLGRTKIQPAEDYERKSVGTESTFREISDKNELREKLRHTAEELEGDLKRTEFKGRTLCLKVKLHTFEVLTRQIAPPHAVWQADDLYKYSLPMLEKLMKEIPNMKLRLMGLRATHIVGMKKPGIDFFGRHRSATPSTTKPKPSSKDNDGEWEAWPEAEFEEAARQERNDELNELEKLSQEHEKQQSNNPPEPINSNDQIPEELPYICPICSLSQPPNDKAFNDHIDFCLSRQTIKEAVKATASPDKKPQGLSKPMPSKTKGKRGRPKNEALSLDKGRNKRRAFFSTGGA
ncbi:DNA-directed polymeras-like protein kappa [Zopfia rhizophila CBS 207.26]|uniref:DNA polymerase kappa n=1 Tax=Zopfia rhizophila CBS 207.26 TaxID=1314779 RepID=A0A6A6EMN6_9PEZI|nr:DNA-directed polymeras-like protein kappa [Zopfia rhizophila CBS 207.26]